MHDTGQAGHAGPDGGDVVSHVGTHGIRRGLATIGVLPHVAREGLRGGVEAAAVHILGQARLAVAGDVGDGELGVDGPEGVVGEIQTVELATLGGLDEDIGVGDEVQQNLAAFGGTQPQSHGALVAALGLGLDVVQGTGVIIGVCILDPNDVGAILRHKGGAQGTRQRRGRMDDLQTLKQTKLRQIRIFRPHVVSPSHILLPWSAFRGMRTLTRAGLTRGYCAASNLLRVKEDFS